MWDGHHKRQVWTVIEIIVQGHISGIDFTGQQLSALWYGWSMFQEFNPSLQIRTKLHHLN